MAVAHSFLGSGGFPNVMCQETNKIGSGHQRQACGVPGQAGLSAWRRDPDAGV